MADNTLYYQRLMRCLIEFPRFFQSSGSPPLDDIFQPFVGLALVFISIHAERGVEGRIFRLLHFRHVNTVQENPVVLAFRICRKGEMPRDVGRAVIDQVSRKAAVVCVIIDQGNHALVRGSGGGD